MELRRQYDAAATDLRALFTSQPDFTPYNFKTIQFVTRVSPEWLALTRHIDFSRPDADEVKLREAIVKSEGCRAQSGTIRPAASARSRPATFAYCVLPDTIRGSKTKTLGSCASIRALTQCVLRAPNVSTRVKFVRTPPPVVRLRGLSTLK